MHVDGVMLMKDLSRIRKIAGNLGLAGSELAIRRALITASRELKLPCDLSSEERCFSDPDQRTPDFRSHGLVRAGKSFTGGPP